MVGLLLLSNSSGPEADEKAVVQKLTVNSDDGVIRWRCVKRKMSYMV